VDKRRNFARKYLFADSKLNEELDRIFVELKRIWEGKVKEYADLPVINFNSQQTFNMSATGETLAILASKIAGMQTSDGKTVLYTVPTSYKCVITHIIIKDPTDNLSGGTNYSFGKGSDANDWAVTINLDGMTTGEYIIIQNIGVSKSVYTAGDEFGIKPVTGSTADADATIDVIGYIY